METGIVGYLDKYRAEIINYEERKRLGKVIGNGRVESGVNQVVGERQKHNGMNRRTSGSKSLGILKAVQLNDQWNELFYSERLAA